MWHFVNEKSTNVGARTVVLCAVISLKIHEFFRRNQVPDVDSCNAFNHLAKAGGKDVSIVLPR